MLRSILDIGRPDGSIAALRGRGIVVFRRCIGSATDASIRSTAACPSRNVWRDLGRSLPGENENFPRPVVMVTTVSGGASRITRTVAGTIAACFFRRRFLLGRGLLLGGFFWPRLSSWSGRDRSRSESGCPRHVAPAAERTTSILRTRPSDTSTSPSQSSGSGRSSPARPADRSPREAWRPPVRRSRRLPLAARSPASASSFPGDRGERGQARPE